MVGGSRKYQVMRLNPMVTAYKTVRLVALVVGMCIFLPAFALAQSTIAFVQGNYSAPQSSQTSVAVKYNAAQTGGNLNVVVVGWNDTTRTVSSVTDSNGNPYVLAVGPTAVSGFISQSIYYAKNILPAAAGANTVTVQFSGAASFADIRILEYAGADPVNPVDVSAAASGNSGSANSGTATTTNATDLLFGASIVTTLTSAPGTNFTQRVLSSPDGDIAEDRMVTATGSYGATATVAPSGRWIMQMVAFKTPGTVLGDTQPPTAPSGLGATSAGGTQINLSWTASTDNVGVTGYRVERCQGVGCSSFAQIATPATTSFNDTGVTAGTSYSYRVRATDAAQCVLKRRDCSDCRHESSDHAWQFHGYGTQRQPDQLELDRFYGQCGSYELPGRTLPELWLQQFYANWHDCKPDLQ
jgi:hypothetical protein